MMKIGEEEKKKHPTTILGYDNDLR